MKPYSTQERDADELAPTRASLVDRLKDWNDQQSWKEFFERYWKLIYSVAIKSGLSDQEAEDVVQETVLSVAKKMSSFKYDPDVCSFKGWLMHMTRLRIIDQLRKRPPVQQRPLRNNGTSRTSTVERMPDPGGLELDQVWDEEWRKNMVDAAMDRVKRRIKPDHYQIFYLLVVKKISAGKVASMLGTNVARVYLVKHRVAALIKADLKILEEKANSYDPAKSLA